MISWDETDVIACLEAESKTDEERISFSFEARRGPLRVLLLVCPYHNDVEIRLYHDGISPSVVSMSLTCVAEIRRKHGGGTDELQFMPGYEQAESPACNSVVILQMMPTLAIHM